MPRKKVVSYSTDDEAWRERERLEMVGQARKDVAAMARIMLEGKDRNRVARLMGIEKLTLAAKVSNGRFTAIELVMLSYLCGYKLKLEDEYQLVIEGMLE